MKSKIITFIVLVFIFLSCHSNKTTSKETNSNTTTPSTTMDRKIVFAPGPQTIIYKTKKDYSNLVPVTMDNSKTRIVSYPAPSDIYYNGVLAKPTLLKNGYLLDNRGINENVAFLNYTYEEYSKLQEAPSMDEMLSKIAEKSPLVELINCGLRRQYKDEINELNTLIDANFAGCERIKVRSSISELKNKIKEIESK